MRMRHCQLFYGLVLILAASVVYAAPPAATAKKAPAGAGATKKGKNRPPHYVLAPRKNTTPPSWTIAEYHSDAPGNVFYNTETVKLSLVLTAKDASQPLAIKGGTWRIKEIEDRDGWSWHAEVRIRETDTVLAQGPVASQAGNKLPLTIEWKPTRLGGFGVYLKIDDGSGRRNRWFGVSSWATRPRRVSSPTRPSSLTWGARPSRSWRRPISAWEPNGSATRSAGRRTSPNQASGTGRGAMSGSRRPMTTTSWSRPSWPMHPVGPSRKSTEPSRSTTGKTARKPMSTPSTCPSGRSGRDVSWTATSKRSAGVVLNEPWEGGSLSGWHGSGAHYREMLKRLSVGAHAADPTFTVLGNDSGMNVEDNLLVDPGTIERLDAVSTHTYRSYCASNVAQYGAYGKRIWDTESWIGVGASYEVSQVVFQLAQGYVKTQPVSTEHAWMLSKARLQKRAKAAAKARKPAKPKVAGKLRPAAKGKAGPAKAAAPKPTEEEIAQAKLAAQKQAASAISTMPDAATPTYAAPTAQALSTLLHFIEDTDFYREARTESVPWMFVFKGRASGPTPDKNVAVVIGRDGKWDNFPWYRIKSDGRLTISDPDGLLTAYDVKGNPLPRSGPAHRDPADEGGVLRRQFQGGRRSGPASAGRPHRKDSNPCNWPFPTSPARWPRIRPCGLR